MQLQDLPPELLLWAFSNLSYFSLISASAVCRRWRTLIFGDISLHQTMFKAGEDCSSRDKSGFDSQSIGAERQWKGSCSGIDEEIQVR